SMTTVRYVREVINRFLSIHKGKRILTYNKYSEDNPYKLLLGKTSVLYEGDKYAQKYSFLYSKEFMGLSIYEKRILLNTAMQTSLTGNNKIVLNVRDYIYRDDLGAGLIPSKDVLIKSIKNINEIMDQDIEIKYVGNIYTKEDVMEVTVKQELLDKKEENYTERFVLRKLLYAQGQGEYIEDKYCIEIEKIVKYIYKSLLEFGRKYKDVLDTLMYTARDVYTKSIKQSANKIGKMIKRGVSEGEISAYFSGVVFSLITEEAAKYDNECKSKESILKKFGFIGDEYVKESKRVLKVLKVWIEDWVRSRFKEGSVKKVEYDKDVKRNNRLKETTKKMFNVVMNKEKKYVNPINRERESIISSIKEQVENFIDIKNTRMHPIKN